MACAGAASAQPDEALSFFGIRADVTVAELSPRGVWALPPTYGNKDRERARFEAIGESDRFTLKFVKP